MGQFLLNTIKFFFAILLLPLVITTIIVLHKHVVSQYPIDQNMFFFWGEAAFLITYLFVHQFEWLYDFGLKIMQKAFRFLSPLDKVLPYLVPHYLVLMMLIFYVIKKFWLQSPAYDPYIIFFAGFSFLLHIIITARDLQDSEKSIIKPTYLFTFAFAIITTSCLAILLFDLVLQKVTFPEFFKAVTIQAKEMYLNCWNWLYPQFHWSS